MKPIFEDEKKQLIIDYKQTFESPAGKRVLEDLKKKSRVLIVTTPPTGNDGKLDPYMMAYQNGQKSHMVYIYSQLGKDPYEVKQTKAINERENEDG